MQAGATPACLLTMMIEDGERSRSHGLRLDVIKAQAAAMQLPVVTRATSWDAYETRFIDALGEAKEYGIAVGVFGDIDLQEHRDWVERVCRTAGMEAVLPLWNEPRLAMVRECIAVGIDCRIVSCKSELMGKEYLGQRMTHQLAEELDGKGIDAGGENGGYGSLFGAT